MPRIISEELPCCGTLQETDEEFERKMECGYADAVEGRGKSLDGVFDDLKKCQFRRKKRYCKG